MAHAFGVIGSGKQRGSGFAVTIVGGGEGLRFTGRMFPRGTPQLTRAGATIERNISKDLSKVALVLFSKMRGLFAGWF